MPDAGVLATILLIVGLFLLALELMIPSFGMIGILSAISLLISAWSAWQAWWGTSPGFFWTYAAFWLLGIPSVLGGMLFLLQNTSLGDRIVLRGPAGHVPVSRPGAKNPLHDLVGKTGTAASLLTPGGMVIVNNERFHAESPGMMIESGSRVQVIDVKGNRLVVKKSGILSPEQSEPKVGSGSETDPLADTLASTELAGSMTKRVSADNGSNVLDFEVPES